MGIDLKNFYLNTPMDRREFLRMKIDNFPEDIIKQYNLRQKVDNKGMVTIRVKKGMYGLPDAGIIAQDLLIVPTRSPVGHRPTTRKRNSSLWGQSPVYKRRQQVTVSAARRQTVHSASHRNFPILRTSRGLNHVSGTKCNCVGSSQTNRKNDGKDPSVPRLCRGAP